MSIKTTAKTSSFSSDAHHATTSSWGDSFFEGQTMNESLSQENCLSLCYWGHYEVVQVMHSVDEVQVYVQQCVQQNHYGY